MELRRHPSRSTRDSSCRAHRRGSPSLKFALLFLFPWLRLTNNFKLPCPCGLPFQGSVKINKSLLKGESTMVESLVP
jgi:hypothetical protein